MAVEHPHANAVGNHVGGYELGGQNRKDVGVVLVDRNHVAMPMWRVKIDLAAHGHHIPADVLTAFHDWHGQVAEHVAINGSFVIGGGKARASEIEVALQI